MNINFNILLLQHSISWRAPASCIYIFTLMAENTLCLCTASRIHCSFSPPSHPPHFYIKLQAPSFFHHYKCLLFLPDGSAWPTPHPPTSVFPSPNLFPPQALNWRTCSIQRKRGCDVGCRDAVGMRWEGCIWNNLNYTCKELVVTETEGKCSISWIRWETVPGFSLWLTTRVLHVWRQGLKDMVEREGLTQSKEPQQWYSAIRGREEVFQERMGGLGWCLTTVFTLLKFFFHCIFPFWRQRKSKKTVQLIF